MALSAADYLYTEGGARYLSPFFSPDLESWGLDLPFTYAFFVIWVPLGLPRHLLLLPQGVLPIVLPVPPACAVTGPRRRRYRGEAAFPYVLMNAHRFFLYLATIVLGFLWYDAGARLLLPRPGRLAALGVGVGSLVLVANVVLLSAVHLRL